MIFLYRITSKVARFLMTKSSIVMLRLIGTGSETLGRIISQNYEDHCSNLLDWVNVKMRYFKGVKGRDAQVRDTWMWKFHFQDE